MMLVCLLPLSEMEPMLYEQAYYIIWFVSNTSRVACVPSATIDSVLALVEEYTRYRWWTNQPTVSRPLGAICWAPDTPFQTCTNTSTWHTMEVGLRTMNPNGMAVLSGCALMTHYVLKRLTLKCGMSPIIPHSTQSVKLQKIASIRRCILSREQHI